MLYVESAADTRCRLSLFSNHRQILRDRIDHRRALTRPPCDRHIRQSLTRLQIFRPFAD